MEHPKELYHIYDPKLFNISDFNVLLHEILKQTRTILNSEAGSVYISEGEFLYFNVFQNDAMSYENIYKQFYDLKDVKLPLNDDKKYLAVESFISKKIICVDDVYQASEYNFLGVKEFDERFDYRTKSIISAPIIHPIENKVLGVLQLLNKSENGQLTVFNKTDKSMLSMASSFIAIAISKAQDNIEKLKKLNKELENANEKLQKRVEEEVQESKKKSSIIFHQSKLASLGEMVGNIAHQWRQPLSAISTMASALCLEIECNRYDKEASIQTLDNIVAATKHLSQTIDDFRGFYNVDKQKKDFDLSKVISNSLTIIEASIYQNHITLITSLENNIIVSGYENEFKQAILNIIQNAKEALIEKIKDENERLVLIEIKKDEQSIILNIKDNAGGIKKEILSKIFNQSFTTKEKNGGTGLGLYMTKQIIEDNMNANIKVSNQEFMYNNKNYIGAVFTITFKLSNNKNL